MRCAVSPTKPIRRWPSDSRCSVAIRPPRTSSVTVCGTPGTITSTVTSGTPARRKDQLLPRQWQRDHYHPIGPVPVGQRGQVLVALLRRADIADHGVVALLVKDGQDAGQPRRHRGPGQVRKHDRHRPRRAAGQRRGQVARPVAELPDHLQHPAAGRVPDIRRAVDDPRDRADADARSLRHLCDGHSAIAAGGARGDRRPLETLPRRRDIVLLASRGRAVRLRAGPAGALAQPQPGGHYLARLLIGSVVDLAQRPVHHPPGDLVDRDGHGGQPRVHQGGRRAAVEAGHGEVLADPQPEFRGHAVDHPGEPVTAGYDGVRPQPGRPADSSDRIFPRALPSSTSSMSGWSADLPTATSPSLNPAARSASQESGVR